MTGRVFRRCACRGPDGRQIGKDCPKLATDSRHGTWSFALEQPVVAGRRSTMRRSGFPTRKAAQAVLGKLVERRNVGVTADDRETLAQYLTDWIAEQQRSLKPTTWANYHRYVVGDLVPALGTMPLEQLTHTHVARLITDLEAAGRGAVTVRRIHATLRSALAAAVKRRRLAHNPAVHAALPEVTRTERGGWGVVEAISFLAHVADADDRDAELFEVLIGTGLRRARRSPCAGRMSTSRPGSRRSARRCRASTTPAWCSPPPRRAARPPESGCLAGWSPPWSASAHARTPSAPSWARRTPTWG